MKNLTPEQKKQNKAKFSKFDRYSYLIMFVLIVLMWGSIIYSDYLHYTGTFCQ